VTTSSGRLIYALQNNVAQGLHVAPSGLDLGDIANRTTRLTEGGLAGFWFFWNSVSIGEWVYNLFGGELRGYGSDQQRWHRVWAIGFIGAYAFGTVQGLIIMWHYRKNPKAIKMLEERIKQKEQRKQDKQ
uniref:hypothetical protein n=1 Tax=Vreelandella olivaria TaxID=390919 RepID=UPI00201F571B